MSSNSTGAYGEVLDVFLHETMLFSIMSSSERMCGLYLDPGSNEKPRILPRRCVGILTITFNWDAGVTVLKERVRILETEANTLMDRAVWYL